MKMRHLTLNALLLALAVHELYAQFGMPIRSGGMPAKPACELRNDHLNPFYWKGQENICSDEICKANPLLQCNITRDFIMDQAYSHDGPEDILQEIQYMEKYFHTFFPKPRDVLPYSCKGVCSMGDKNHPRDPQQVTRVFADIQAKNSYGMLETKRALCHIMGPTIFAHQCGGPCKIPFAMGNQGNMQCVADSSVTVHAWAFCPGHWPACQKIPVSVPMSCSCHKITCSKPLPQYIPFTPILPLMQDPFANQMGGPQGGPFAQDPFMPGGNDPNWDPNVPLGPAGFDPAQISQDFGLDIGQALGPFGSPMGPVQVGNGPHGAGKKGGMQG